MHTPNPSLFWLTVLVLVLHVLALLWGYAPVQAVTPAHPALWSGALHTRTVAAPAPPAQATPIAPAAPTPLPLPVAAATARPRPRPHIDAPVRPLAPLASEDADIPQATLQPEAAPDTAPDTTPEPAPEPLPQPLSTLSQPSPHRPEEPVQISALQITAAHSGTHTAQANTPPPVHIPPSMRLVFEASGEVKRLHYSASAELRWQHDGQRYQATQEIRAFLVGARVQTSVGRLGAWGLQPQRFGDRSRSERAAHFDFEAGRITFSANTPDAPLSPGAQDRLSVLIELAALLAADPQHYPQGTEIALTTASARAADRWVFRVMETDTLELPVGTMTAVRLQRSPQREYDQSAEVWLAPALHYLPVRLRLVQSNGDFVDLRLQASTPLPSL